MPPQTGTLQTGTLLIPRDIGAEWGRQQALELGQQLELRLNQPVVLYSLEDQSVQFAEAVQRLVDQGTNRLVFAPLGLLPFSERGSIRRSMAWAKRQWPSLSCHVAEPLTWLEWSSWLRLTVLDALNERKVTPPEVAVLLAGQSGESPLTNANLARIAHLVWESSSFASVGHAFVDGLQPTIGEAIRVFVLQGIRHVMIVPWLLHSDALRRLDVVISTMQSQRLDQTKVALLLPGLAHPAIVNLFVSNHYAALSDDRSAAASDSDVDDSAANSNEASPNQAPPGIRPEEAFELEELERRLNAILPPEYQGRYNEVRAESMGTAGLKFDSDGKVAWGEIWTSFCDLALAGGPPHRGTLLEAVTSEAALAEAEQYQAVVTEIERGIRLVTSLPVVTSRVHGWVGVRCESEEMAIWLMRAIIVENIMVRREGEVIYLPAGPRFTVKREIKNVITAIAKTVHYWTAHLNSMRKSH